MFRKLTLISIFLMATISLPAISSPLPEKDDEIEFDDDDDDEQKDDDSNNDDEENPDKKKKTQEDETELDSDPDDDENEKDDIEIAADNVGKVKQVGDKETPITASNMDSNYIIPKLKTSYFALEFLAGAKAGLLDLDKNIGFGFDISPVFRTGKHFAIGVNVLFGALFNSEGDYLQTLGIQLDPRVYFPLKKGSSGNDFPKGTIEGFINLKTGYITQQTMIDSSKVELVGINLAIGFGIDYYLSKILKLSFQFNYYFPYWLEACSDYSGQHHCSKPEIDGHMVSFTSGISLIF
jgi:hypothetical protein